MWCPIMCRLMVRHHPQSNCKVKLQADDCPVQVSKAQWFANLLFWVVVLGAKGAFDYFAIIKPLKLPMQALWNRGFLRSGGWY